MSYQLQAKSLCNENHHETIARHNSNIKGFNRMEAT